jgi:plasmid stabilization system protein ParE
VKPVVFLLGPEEEMTDAARYYEHRRDGLGELFLLRIRTAVRELAERPKSCPAVRGPIRRKLVRQFPYAVLFREEEDEIVVIAVAHLRRRPGYWAPRLR